MKKVLLWLFTFIGIGAGLVWITTIMFIIWDDNHDKVLYWKILGTCTLSLVFWYIIFNIVEEEIT